MVGDEVLSETKEFIEHSAEEYMRNSLSGTSQTVQFQCSPKHIRTDLSEDDERDILVDNILSAKRHGNEKERHMQSNVLRMMQKREVTLEDD